MGIDTFNVVVVVDQDIHKVLRSRQNGPPCFGLVHEDIGSHYFCRAVSYFQVSVGDFVFNEVVFAFDMFCSFGA